ncbi:MULTISPECIES: VirB3 family type IV secretion system protein [unclassified Rhizobium]|uniref:VirB3 family type IV secretion system protein n=1 Tax=unclassified Rhizobium TaxID=2613769 RepID=UPI002180BEA9
MIAGVTMEAMGVNIMLTTILYITAGSIAYALVGVAFHVLFRALVKHDHNHQRGDTGCKGIDFDIAARQRRDGRSSPEIDDENDEQFGQAAHDRRVCLTKEG